MLPATPLLLSVMVRVPESGPLAVGVKVTLIVQEALAATPVPQLLASPKLVLAAMLVMVSAELPVFLKVITCDALVVPTVWFPKLKLEEDKLATGTAIPVPPKFTVCTLPAMPLLLSVMVRVPASGPPAAGEKVTLIVQKALAATLPPQLLVSPKLGLATMPPMMSAELPELFKMTGCEALIVPTL